MPLPPAPAAVVGAATAGPSWQDVLQLQTSAMAHMTQTTNSMAMTVFNQSAQQTQAREHREAAVTQKEMKKEQYDEEVVAKLCGYCGVSSPSQIPPIWQFGGFLSKKEVAAQRTLLLERMRSWEAHHGKDTDVEELRWDDKKMKELVKGNMSPYTRRPAFKFFDAGPSILGSRPKSDAEIQSGIEVDE